VNGRLGDFEIVRQLGAGAFGEVHEAFDRRQRMRVALKRLHVSHPDALFRFKREFRALADIFHPNLATLYELFTDEDAWFIVMELVHGVDIVSFSRPDALVALAPTVDVRAYDPSLGRTTEVEPMSDGVDVGRLRASLVQLAAAVEALHDAGRVHRDLKPSNVLVNAEGTVKVLDFGLVARFGVAGGESMQMRAGTPAYMAPEQARGEEVSPFSDWYAVGALLYEALSGQLPFEGDAYTMMCAKQERAADDPRTLRPSLPDDLCELCVRLLDRDPVKRPSGREIIDRAGRGRVSSPRPPRPSSTFVGRLDELGALDAALEGCRAGASAVVHVLGPSGIGKSALVHAFLNRAAAAGPVIALQGRCYEGDLVPFKAVDTIVDALTARLLRARPDEIARVLPRDFRSLTRLFPALRRLERHASAPSRIPDSNDPFEVRRRGFGALRDMIGRLGAAHPVAIWIDDFQWGDGDSVALLQELLAPPDAPSVLLIVSYRSDALETNPVLRELRRSAAGGRFCEVVVRRLAPTELTQLVETLLSATGTPAEADVDAVVRESGGDPLFAHELARHVLEGARSTDDVSLDSLIAHRLQRLDPRARAAIEVIAVAANALDVTVLREALRVSAEDAHAMLAALKAEHLVRFQRTDSQDLVAIYHDRIGERARAMIGPAAMRAWHRELAAVLETRRDLDHEVIASHYLAVGERERAAQHVERAAENASRSFAFEHAAVLYGQLMAITSDDAPEQAGRRLLLAEALANAGHGAAAAKRFEEASEGAAPSQRLELQRRAAEQLLRSGHFDEGMKAIARVLSQIGMRLPSTPLAVLFLTLLYRCVLAVRGTRFVPRPAAELLPREAARLDATWSVAFVLSPVDPVTGLLFQTQHVLLALRSGDEYRIARALAVEIAHLGVGGRRNLRRIRDLGVRAHAIAERAQSTYAKAMVTACQGIAGYVTGEFRTALTKLDEAQALFREKCSGSWYEIANTQYFAMNCLGFLGEMRELKERHGVYLREARARGDIFASVNLCFGISNSVWLAADDPDRARAECTGAMKTWAPRGFTLEHAAFYVTQTEIDLYRGTPEAAYARLEGMWPALERSLLLRVQLIRITIWYMRARSAIAWASTGRGDTERLLRGADRDAIRIAKEQTPYSVPHGALLRAGVARVRGGREKERVGEWLEEARRGFDRAEMKLAASVTRRCIAGEQGRANGVAAEDEWMRGQEIRRPDRFVRIVAPGF
jgi:hypothetical protein